MWCCLCDPTFSCFSRTVDYDRLLTDGRTGGQTDGRTLGHSIYRGCIASRGKNHQYLSNTKKDAHKRKLIPFFCLTVYMHILIQICVEPRTSALNVGKNKKVLRTWWKTNHASTAERPNFLRTHFPVLYFWPSFLYYKKDVTLLPCPSALKVWLKDNETYSKRCRMSLNQYFELHLYQSFFNKNEKNNKL